MNDAALTIFRLLLVFILVFLNGFFVAAEFAIVKIRTSRLNQLIDEGNRKAKVAYSITNNLDTYLSATQLGITLASLGLGWVGEPTIADLIQSPLSYLGVPKIAIHTIAFIIGFAIITFFHIILGELVPKSLAIHRTEGTVLNIARPLILFYKVMYPFIWILNESANTFLGWVGIQPAKEGELAHTEEEIRILVTQSYQSGFINNTEMSLFDNIFDFSDRIAREIMVPRVDMVTIDIHSTHEEILQTIEQEQLTRYPVAKGDKDHILGFVHVKDLYLQISRKKDFSVRDILRKVIMVSEVAEISTVLKQMQKNNTQIALVIDEFGGTAGLITLEDIIEELVGEIRDEFDYGELPPVQKLNHGYSVEGRVLVEEINDLLGIEIDNVEIETIGGWMYSNLTQRPEKGVSIEKYGFLFMIQKMDDNRIERISIQRLPKTESDNL